MTANIVITAGTFDVLHRGHVELFRKCKMLAGEDGAVGVLVNTDDFVKRFKGEAPLVPLADRVAVIRQMRDVAVVGTNDSFDMTDLLLKLAEQLRDNDYCSKAGVIVVVGDDWAATPGAYAAQTGLTHEWCLKHNVELIYVSYYPGVSSSVLKENWARRHALASQGTFEFEV